MTRSWCSFATVFFLYICMHTLPCSGEYPAIIANMACKTKRIFRYGVAVFTQQPDTINSMFMNSVVSDYQSFQSGFGGLDKLETQFFSPLLRFVVSSYFVFTRLFFCHTSDRLKKFLLLGLSLTRGLLVSFVLYAQENCLILCLTCMLCLFGNMDKLWRSSVFVCFSLCLIPSLFHRVTPFLFLFYFMLCYLIVFFPPFFNHLLYFRVTEYLQEGCVALRWVWVRIWVRLG